MTVRVSFDDAKTWSHSKLVNEGFLGLFVPRGESTMTRRPDFSTKEPSATRPTAENHLRADSALDWLTETK